MLTFLRRLFSPTTPTPATPEEARRLARLLVGEIKMYNEKAVARLREEPGSASHLLPELRRSFRVFTKRAGEGSEAGRIFREEAIQVLADGDAAALEPALTELFQKPFA